MFMWAVKMTIENSAYHISATTMQTHRGSCQSGGRGGCKGGCTCRSSVDARDDCIGVCNCGCAGGMLVGSWWGVVSMGGRVGKRKASGELGRKELCRGYERSCHL